jgi:hypothetical protein
MEVGKWVRNVAFATHATRTGWGEAAERGPCGEGAILGGAGGEKLKVKRPKETKHQKGRVSRQGERGGCGEEKASFVRSPHGRQRVGGQCGRASASTTAIEASGSGICEHNRRRRECKPEER